MLKMRKKYYLIKIWLLFFLFDFSNAKNLINFIKWKKPSYETTADPDFDSLKDTYEIRSDIPNNTGEHVILDLEISVTDGNSVVSRTINPAGRCSGMVLDRELGGSRQKMVGKIIELF